MLLLLKLINLRTVRLLRQRRLGLKLRLIRVCERRLRPRLAGLGRKTWSTCKLACGAGIRSDSKRRLHVWLHLLVLRIGGCKTVCCCEWRTVLYALARYRNARKRLSMLVLCLGVSMKAVIAANAAWTAACCSCWSEFRDLKL